MITLFFPFAREMSRRLIQNEFSAVVGDSNKAELCESTRAISFSKETGSTFYIVTLINVNEFTDDMICQLTAKTDFCLTDNLNYKNTIVLSLLISDADTTATDAVIRTAESFYNQRVYPVYWKINLSGREIKCSKNQPNEILNVRRLISETMSCSDAAEDSSDRALIRDIVMNALEESPLKPVDKSYTFTLLFLAINTVILAVTGAYGFFNPQNPVILFGDTDPSKIINDHEFYRLVSSMFIHSGLLHFGYNSVSLFIFGSRVEKYFGFIKFLAIYFISGICGGIASVFLTGIPGIGASGAIFGLIGASAAYSGVFGVSLEGLSFHTILIFIITGLALGFVGENIDNFAHIGGLLAGLLLGFLFTALKKSKIKKTR